MYYRDFIITSIEAERILAMKFDEVLVPYLNPMIISDDELAELLIKLMRGMDGFLEKMVKGRIHSFFMGVGHCIINHCI